MTEPKIRAGRCANCETKRDNLMYAARYDGGGMWVCSIVCANTRNAKLMGEAWGEAAKRAGIPDGMIANGVALISDYARESKEFPTTGQIKHMEDACCAFCGEDIKNPLPDPYLWGFCGEECQAESEMLFRRGTAPPRFVIVQNGSPVAFDNTFSGARIKMQALALADEIRKEGMRGARIVPGVVYCIFDSERKKIVCGDKLRATGDLVLNSALLRTLYTSPPSNKQASER